jgi:hypothetical protein
MGVMSAVDLVAIHEHPEWQKPLFAALDRRGLRWRPFDRVVDWLIAELASRASRQRPAAPSSSGRAA